MLVTLLCFGGCVAFIGGVGNEVDKEANKKHTVVYEVTGSGGKAEVITYTSTDSSGTEQVTGAALPWKKETTSKGLWNAYTVDAQLASGSSITCRILIDGKEITKKTSTGQYAGVTCEVTSDDVPGG